MNRLPDGWTVEDGFVHDKDGSIVLGIKPDECIEFIICIRNGDADELSCVKCSKSEC